MAVVGKLSKRVKREALSCEGIIPIFYQHQHPDFEGQSRQIDSGEVNFRPSYLQTSDGMTVKPRPSLFHDTRKRARIHTID